MKSALTKAKKVAAIREQRSLRARREAQREWQRSQEAVATAQKHFDRRAEQRNEAEQAFTNEPASEQAQIWLTFASQKVDAAKRDHTDMVAKCSVAQLDAARAKRDHERACQRVEIFEEELTKDRLARVRKEEERALDDLSEQSR